MHPKRRDRHRQHGQRFAEHPIRYGQYICGTKFANDFQGGSRRVECEIASLWEALRIGTKAVYAPSDGREWPHAGHVQDRDLGTIEGHVGGTVMPFVNISLARGKSPEYLDAVSQAVHNALVSELDMKPGDRFQVIDQHDPIELKFDRDFSGGPRSDDWIVFRITDGLERREAAKRRFYKTLVRLLGEDPGIRPADVLVMMTVTPPENFSFADGVFGADVAAAEALDAAEETSGTRSAHTQTEMSDAITALFTDNDRSAIVPMLRDDAVLKVPTTLPYGGEFTGPAAFDAFFLRFGHNDTWESFVVSLDEIIESDKRLIARLTNTAVPKGGGRTVVVENLWLFEVAGGKFTRVQLYADTAAAQSTTT